MHRTLTGVATTVTDIGNQGKHGSISNVLRVRSLTKSWTDLKGFMFRSKHKYHYQNTNIAIKF